MLKRFITLLSFFIFYITMVSAQSTMTDEQVAQYVLTENQKGTSHDEIIKKLISRGVSVEQLQRIKSKYEKQNKGSVMGAKDITGTSELESRMRKNNGEKKRDAAVMRKESFEDRDKRRILSKKQREQLKLEQEDSYYQNLDFLLIDSITSFDDFFEKETYKNKKTGKEIFGHNIFSKKNLTFEPEMNISVPEDYVLGPGDQVIIDVWGASQKTLFSEVSPEGIVNVEGYGPLSVSGMTLPEANRYLMNTLGRIYENSQVKLTIGQTKTITVNVMGEVVAPGTYTLSAFSTVFHALYMAGGPNEIGSLRNIQVFRNNKLISTVDVYDYILRGRLSGNIRLMTNDVVLVGPYLNLVEISGKVKRPMIYEMKDSESVGTLIDFAGGFMGDAYQDNIRLIRKQGDEMSVYSINEAQWKSFLLNDCDSLFVDSVLERYSNMVNVKGAVRRPGMYDIAAASTVRQLIEIAGGLQEDAMKTRAVLHRKNKDNTLKVISLDLEGILDRKQPDLILYNEDVLFIPGLADLQNARTVSIYGEILYPGKYQHADSMTIEDLILQAGGLLDASSLVKVDVSRRMRDRKALTSENTVALTYSFALKDGFVVDGTSGFVLQPYDEVFVRKSPGYVEQEHVLAEGEVAFSGIYTINKKNYRLTDLIRDAGGLNLDAYSTGARLERVLTESEKLKQLSMMKLLTGKDSLNMDEIELANTKYIGINLDKALENPGNDRWDIVLHAGDRLYIPKFDNTVTISGAVMYPNTIVFKEGAKLDYYINQAGGFKQDAYKKKVFAINMNGTVSRVRRAKDIQPGSQIVVPIRRRNRLMNFTEILSLSTASATIATAIATLVK